MTFQKINQIIEGIGYPCAYYQFPEGQAPDPPFICYFYDSSNDLYADGMNYQKIERLYIELYTDTKDFEAEATVEKALAGAGFSWAREETPIDSERLYEVIYSLDVIIMEDENGEQD